jgi:hypothetical protein
LRVAVISVAAAISLAAAISVVAFAQHRLSLVAAHVLAAEVSADWLADPNSTMEAVGCLPLDHTDSLAQPGDR